MSTKTHEVPRQEIPDGNTTVCKGIRRQPPPQIADQTTGEECGPVPAVHTVVLTAAVTHVSGRNEWVERKSQTNSISAGSGLEISLFLDVLDSLYAFKVFVLSPDRSIVSTRGRQNDAVCHWQLQVR